MEIKVETMKRCELITLSGQVDSATAPELEQKLLGMIQAGQKNLVINLSAVPFISSAGLKALVAAQIRARKALPAGEVVLSEVPPKLADTLELVGLHRIFTICDNDAQAVGSF